MRCKALFTNEQLQALIRQEVISEQYPYSTRDEQELKNYLKAILDELERTKIRCKVATDHFGSGYASYIQWFCHEDQHVEVKEYPSKRVEDIQGLHVLISRLTPVIMIGNANESSTYSLSSEYLGGGNSMLDEPHQLVIEPRFEQLFNALVRMFMKYNFTVLRKEDVELPLPFDADIPTLSRDKRKYLVWDAIFYWED